MASEVSGASRGRATRNHRGLDRDGADGEKGSASVVVLAAGLAIMMIGLTALTLGSIVHARHRAQIGADAAALAGAMRVVEGASSACDRAAELAEANNTALSGCAVNGSEVSVHTQVALPEPLQAWGVVSAVAVAAPADPGLLDTACPPC